MRRRGRAAAALIAGLVATSILAGCAGDDRIRGDTACPPRLAGALADRGIVGGTPTLRVAEAGARDLRSSSPTLSAAFRGCVLRVTFVFQPAIGTYFEGMTPGGQGTVQAMSAALLRDGWQPRQARDGVTLVRGDGERAHLFWVSQQDLAPALPAGFSMPAGSAFADGPVAFLEVSRAAVAVRSGA